MAKCRHLQTSDEAYRNGEPAAVFLCAWPTNKLGIIPRWLDRQVGGGIMVDHKTECVGCPCYEKLDALSTPSGDGKP